MAAVREFGFICGDLAVGQENGLLVPRSEQTYLARSLIPGGDEAELTGRYLLRVYHKGSVVCKAKVDVAWDARTAQSDACLGMKVEDTAAFTEALGKACGKHVELRFTRIAKGLAIAGD
jgi:hypothetical protein